MLRLEVFDINFNRLGVINKYKFIQYTDKCKTYGSFELKCPINEETVSMLKEDRIVWIEDGIAGIVQYLDFDTSKDTLEVKGNLIHVIFDWRFIYPTLNTTDYPNLIIESAVESTCIKSADIARNYPFLKLEKSSIPNLEKIAKQSTGDTLTTFIEEVCSTSELLYVETTFEPKIEKFVFKVKRGVDRTDNTSPEYVVFSRDIDNILNSVYTKNTEPFRNYTLIAGAGEGSERKVYETYNSAVEPSGFTRRELYTDARDITDTKQIEVATGEVDEETGVPIMETQTVPIPIEEYNELLKQRGEEKLDDCQVVTSYSGELSNNTTYVYGKDYYKGDKVQIVDKKIGVRLSAVVESVTITYDDNGKSIEPAFGFSQPTLIRILKKKGVL